MDYSSEQRAQVLAHLSEEIKEVFTDYETTKALISIGEKYNLSDEEQEALGEAVGLVLLGILKRKEFQEYLYKKIDQDKSTIHSIVKETRGIFQPIAAQLEKLDPEEILKRAREQEREESGVNNIPVPPPPGTGDTPSPSYGGTSDPYREPVDD